MKSAYNETWLHNLDVVKEAKRWCNQGMISNEQLHAIRDDYKSSFYHPNMMIRILLFIASLIALGGITGLLGLIVSVIVDFNDSTVFFLLILYGVVSFIFLDKVFIDKANHYKSGVTEALLYHAIGYTIGGLAGLTDFDNSLLIIIFCLIIFSFAAFRYLDLISTACALFSFAGLIFYEMYEAGGVIQQVIPIAFIVVFTPLYFFFKKQKAKIQMAPWLNCLILLEALCLLLVYAAGNYLVVRELSIELMNLYLEEGQDIPLAMVFYSLTVIIPVAYLYFGIKNKDIVLLRVSLAALAFSVFTFKFYYSTGHHEITFTASGAILLILSVYLFRYLKTPKYGYTREPLLREKWADMNPEAFVISQTLGGNQVTTDATAKGGGGSFSGGGSTDSF